MNIMENILKLVEKLFVIGLSENDESDIFAL